MSLINMRNGLMAGKRLPYDAEVEYLESTGAQWIDTGIAPTEKTGVECSIFWTTTNVNHNPFGVIEDLPGGRTRFMVQIYNSEKPNAYFGTSSSSTRGGAGAGVWNDISLAKGKYVNNDTTVSTVSYSPFSFTRSLACGGYSSAILGETVNCFVGRMRYFRMTSDGALVRDLIPVRKGTVGYMYDRVSGKLFGNDGTGAFTYGNDLKYPIPAE